VFNTPPWRTPFGSDEQRLADERHGHTVQTVAQFNEQSTGNRFRHEVSQHLSSGAIDDSHLPGIDMLLDEVILYHNVLGLRVMGPPKLA
jgi:hypothetical protein